MNSTRVLSIFLAALVFTSFPGFGKFHVGKANAQEKSQKIAQLPDLSIPIERKVPGPGGTVATGFRYDPRTKEIGVLLSGYHVIQPIIENQEVDPPKYTDYNRVTIKNFRYRGIDARSRQVVLSARVRYEKLEARPWPLQGRYTVFDNAADITLGANFKVNNRQLETRTFVREFDADWASGPLGYVGMSLT